MNRKYSEMGEYKKQVKLMPQIPESEETCKVEFPNGKIVELPLLKSNDGYDFIDIRQLYAKTGYFTFDPGYTCTGSCVSQITSIKGNEGLLTYRGYKVKELAEKCTFLEVCYLLLYGDLPSQKELNKFEETVVDEMCIHESMINFYKSFEKDSHPMAIMVSMVGAMSAFMKETDYAKDEYQRQITAIKIISKIPMIAALAFRTSRGLPIVYPKKKYGYIENFLRMMFKNALTPWQCDKVIIEAIEKIFILHADHEQNASTSTVRISGSSMANPYACIAAGIASLWGPNHGGANEAVVTMLETIGSVNKIDEYVEKCKDKKSGMRLMGFGHRVYKNFDPRAVVMKEMAKQISDYLGQSQNRQMLDVALALEKKALEDQYFIDRKLYPNVDFYTGIIYSSIGIPKNMFTVLFAVSRSIGWISQLIESTSCDVIKIGRPRQIYVGYKEREIQDIEKRQSQKMCIHIPKQCDVFKLPILQLKFIYLFCQNFQTFLVIVVISFCEEISFTFLLEFLIFWFFVPYLLLVQKGSLSI